MNRTRKAYRGRFNQMSRAARVLAKLCDQDPDNIEGANIGDMRDEVEVITQCFHEFSAYWNVFHTHEDSPAAPSEHGEGGE